MCIPIIPPAQIDGLIQQYRANYLARGHTANAKSIRALPKALAALGGRKATATTKGSPTTRAVLEQFGLIQYFDHVQGTDGFPCKPAPDVVLAALAALGARPEDCLFVGDSPADMEAGRRAGVRPARCGMAMARRTSWPSGRRITGWRICGSWCERRAGNTARSRLLAGLPAPKIH